MAAVGLRQVLKSFGQVRVIGGRPRQINVVLDSAKLAGLGLELSVVTAVVLGGASLAGGRGGIVGTILAVLIVGVLGNGLIQLRIPSFWIEVFGGVLLLAAVGFDQLRIRLTKSAA